MPQPTTWDAIRVIAFEVLEACIDEDKPPNDRMDVIVGAVKRASALSRVGTEWLVLTLGSAFADVARTDPNVTATQILDTLRETYREAPLSLPERDDD